MADVFRNDVVFGQDGGHTFPYLGTGADHLGFGFRAWRRSTYSQYQPFDMSCEGLDCLVELAGEHRLMAAGCEHCDIVHVLVTGDDLVILRSAQMRSSQ